MRAKAIFVGGTSSNAGKSWMATAICAWLRRRGIAVAPFKAQNMSNNSFPCRGGGEIGRAQVAQAEACGLEPELAMNPILLKPNEGASQVIVNGQVWKTLRPREYYAHVDDLWPHVVAAYEELARRFEIVVIEGAGSVSEINLRPFDLVNLGLVTRLRTPWFLVADIERGGVFGSVAGTVGLLTAEERALFRGFAINKFRGDTSLFEDGARTLEERTGSPCLGVFPYTTEAHLDPEDSLATAAGPSASAPPGARIAIIKFPHLSNSTDFQRLTWADWITTPAVHNYDFILLPGTKSTIGDLQWLRDRRLDEWIVQQRAAGATVIGICGGFQMLGRAVHDPYGVESSAPSAVGLGLLPMETVMTRHKHTRVVSATTPRGVEFSAYEIHMGQTSVLEPLASFARLADGTGEGVRIPGILGTYLHGTFESSAVCSEIFGVHLPLDCTKQAHYARLAEWFDHHQRDFDRLALSVGRP